jgi:RNA polymerase sigma factor (sigma-70 family)
MGLRSSAVLEKAAPRADSELLRRYADSGDETAFELLVWRHAAMVFGVCRRVLHHTQDAEDAFQATWVTLAARARSLRRQESVAAWLYKVAYRVALRARGRANHRASREQPLSGVTVDPAADPGAEAAWRELRRVLDEQLCRLPEQYRSAFVLRCLAGLSGAEAARELGCAEGTVESRLARARARLREALGRRGFAAPTVGLAAGFSLDVLAERAPAALVADAVRAATAFMTGHKAISREVAALTEGVLRNMLLTKIKIATAAVVLAVALFGIGVTRYGTVAGQEVREKAIQVLLSPAPQQPEAKPNTDQIEGEWLLQKVEVGGKVNPDIDWIKNEVRWVITANNCLTIKRFGQSSAGSITLSAGRVPGEIDIKLVEGPVPGERTYQGIYKREGDRLTVCYATTGERPTAFATRPGSSAMLAEFRQIAGAAGLTVEPGALRLRKPVRIELDVFKPIELDPRLLKPFEIDPNLLKPIEIDPKLLKPYDVDPKLLKRIEIDPKLLKPYDVDPKLHRPIEIDPKLLKPYDFDPRLLKPVEIDPRLLEPFHSPEVEAGPAEKEKR